MEINPTLYLSRPQVDVPTAIALALSLQTTFQESLGRAAREAVRVVSLRCAQLEAGWRQQQLRNVDDSRPVQRALATAWSAHAGAGLVTGAVRADGERQDPATLAAVLAEWRAAARAGGGHASLGFAPLAVKAALPVWDDAGAAGRIMRRIKAELDPHNLLNPGRFVAGF